MKIFYKIFDALIIVCWIAGMFFPAGSVLKEILWALPAGYAAGVITARWFAKDELSEFKFNKPIKVYDSRQKDVPPEVQEKMKGLIEALKKEGAIPDDALSQKCKDPHCPACWGLGEK